MGSLGAAAAILLAAAWLVLWPALQVSKTVTLIAALPGLLGIALVIDAVALSFGTAAVDDLIGRALVVLIELSVLLALLALGAAGVEGLLLARYAIVALAATSAGLVHQIAEYVVAIAVSDANWDAPPGSGYVTVAMCLLAASATGVLWWRANRATSMPSESRVGEAASIA
ncbi:MAG: hypothetical protein WAS07_00505 [Micropruina sp.]|nr:hypothetical protein [Micropruina sp.]